MPNVLPTINNEPPQGIQALLDTVYLWNPDVANDLIEKINELLEKIDGLSGKIPPYAELEAPVVQYTPCYEGDNVYVATQDLEELPAELDPAQWILIATKTSALTAGQGIEIEGNEISVTDEVLSGAAAGATAVQPEDLGTAAYASTTDFATAAQGTKADTALQPGSAVPQYVTMPQPTGTTNGRVVQYSGPTTSDFTTGYFYKEAPVIKETVSPTFFEEGELFPFTISIDSDKFLEACHMSYGGDWSNVDHIRIYYQPGEDFWQVTILTAGNVVLSEEDHIDITYWGITIDGRLDYFGTEDMMYSPNTLVGYTWEQTDVQPNEGDVHNLGWYATPTALREAHPTAEDGDYAIVGTTDTVWVWDSDTGTSGAWVDTDTNGQVTSVNGQTGAVTVQETLVNQSNIKSVNGNSLLGSGNLELSTYLTFPAGWTTTGTTKALCDDIAADTTAVAGKAYLGEVTCRDLPASMVNAEIVVEVMDGTTANNKVIKLTCSSGNTAPYMWLYTYWNNGTDVSGWQSFLPTSGGTMTGEIIMSGNLANITFQGNQYGQMGVIKFPDGFGGYREIKNVSYQDGLAIHCLHTQYSNNTGGIWLSGTTTFVAGGINGKSLSYVYVEKLYNGADINVPTVGGKLSLQTDTMPTAGSAYEGMIYQYTGTTDSTYTHGYIYECVSDGATPTPNYSWVQTNVQPTPSGLPSQTGNAGKFLTTDGSQASWGTINALQNNSTSTGGQEIAVGSNVAATNNSSATGVRLGSAISNTHWSTGNAIAVGHNITLENYADGIYISPAGIQRAGGSIIMSAKGTINGNYSGKTGGILISGVGTNCIGKQFGSSTGGAYSILISSHTGSGSGALELDADYSIVINSGYKTGATITEQNTFWWGNNVGLYKLVEPDGTIPTDRFTTTPVADGSYVPTVTILNGTATRTWEPSSSGGSAPTLTWYSVSTAGNTLTIADTSSAQLVKIYKNGLLLQPTEDYTISGTTLTTVAALVVGDKITTEVF